MLLLIALVALTGCIDIIYQVEVAPDGSGNVAVIMAYDENTLGALEQQYPGFKDQPLVDDQVRSAATSAGLGVREVSASGRTGVQVGGSFANPAEFGPTLDKIEALFLDLPVARTTGAFGVQPSLDGTLTVDRRLLSTDYSLTLSTGSAQSSDDGTAAAALEAIMPTKIDYAAAAKLPGKVVSSNGKYSPGDPAITWATDPEDETVEDFNAISQTPNTGVIVAGNVGLVLLLAAVVVLTVRALRKRGAKPAA